MLINYKSAGIAITGIYYVYLINQLTDANRKLCLGVELLHDNAPEYMSKVVLSAIVEYNYSPHIRIIYKRSRPGEYMFENVLAELHNT